MARDYYHPATSRRPMSMYNPEPQPRTLDRYDALRPMAIVMRLPRSHYVVPLLPVVISQEHSSQALEIYNRYHYEQTKENYYERERPSCYDEGYRMGGVIKEESAVMNREPGVRRRSRRTSTDDAYETATEASLTLAEAVACGLARRTSSAEPRARDRDRSRSRERLNPRLMPPVALSGDPDRHPSHENGSETEDIFSSMEKEDERPWICCEFGIDNGILSVEESPRWYRNCCSDCSIDADFLTREMD